jgi:hypothetical protein
MSEAESLLSLLLFSAKFVKLAEINTRFMALLATFLNRLGY